MLVRLAGAPLDDVDCQRGGAHLEFYVLQFARSEADIDALLAALRVACAALPEHRPEEKTPRDPELALRRTALSRLRGQVDSGLIDVRLRGLHDATVALLRAEHEHHLHVHAQRADRRMRTRG